MVKGIWYIDGVEIDGGSVNQMGSILEHYEDGNGTYKVYMLENGLLQENTILVPQLFHYWSMGNART